MAKFLTVEGPRWHLFLKMYAMDPPPHYQPPSSPRHSVDRGSQAEKPSLDLALESENGSQPSCSLHQPFLPGFWRMGIPICATN